MVVRRLVVPDSLSEEAPANVPNPLQAYAQAMAHESEVQSKYGTAWCEELESKGFIEADSIREVGYKVEFVDERGAVLGGIEFQTGEYCFG